MKQRLYDALLRAFPRNPDPRAAEITPGDFLLGERDLDASLDVCAICRGRTVSVATPGLDRAPAVCVWCGRPSEPGATHRGRIRLRALRHRDHRPGADARGAAEAAYGDWYWPEGERRFCLAGDAILRRSRGLLAARIDEVAPARRDPRRRCR